MERLTAKLKSQNPQTLKVDKRPRQGRKLKSDGEAAETEIQRALETDQFPQQGVVSGIGVSAFLTPAGFILSQKCLSPG
jgi:hypothetical protein